MTRQILGALVLISLLTFSCNASNKQSNPSEPNVSNAETLISGDSIIFQTEKLIIRKLSEHTYQHISFLNTETFGRVACNGMIIINGNEAVVFDTPADDESSVELIEHVTKQLNCKINAIIATHFHADCVAGLNTFHKYNIPSYANQKTVEFLKARDSKSGIPKNSFTGKLAFNVGDKSVYSEYFGEGHTKDNVVGYFPEDGAIFGGCLIKEVGAGKGNLEDANVGAWPTTVESLKQKYPETKIVIPGHGKAGGTELFDYTINLFK
jgi:metallo-beta-lactamase class B